MLYSVILAGGSGTRLWPLSTKANPKQINYLLNNQSLLQATYVRLLSGFDQSKIYVATNQNLVSMVVDQLKVNESQIFVEPQARNTAAAIGLAAVQLLVKDEQAIIVTINSDAYVREVDKYLSAIFQAGELVKQRPDKFVLLGIKPQYPETGYGYIKLGLDWSEVLLENKVFNVHSFKEKPDLATAEKYCQSGEYLWNPAIFVFSAKALLAWYQQYLPEVYQSLENIRQALLKGAVSHYQAVITEEYQKIPSISIDYGLLEKLPTMLVMPTDITWADIGHWRSLRDVQLAVNHEDNIVQGEHVSIDSRRNLLYAKNKLIATIGVEDMILVETDKVIFLCPANRAREVKDLLEKLKEQDLENYL